MKKKRRQRVVSIFMAMLMILGLIPMDFTVTTAKAAEGSTTHTFDASVELSAVAQGAAIAGGASYANNYFALVGDAKRGNSSTYSIELAQDEASYLQFTVAGTADVTIQVTSTGGSNTSAVALTDGTTTITESTGIQTVTGTSSVTNLVYTNIPAGTYKIVSPDHVDYARGVRVLKAEVVEYDLAPVTVEYKFVAATDLASVAQNATITGGATYADGYFALVGDAKRGNSSTFSLELAQDGTNYLQFTVMGVADIAIEVTSTGGSNTSPVAISDGTNLLTEATGKTTCVGTSSTTILNYTNVPAGTYRILSPDHAEFARGFRLLNATVSQTTSGTKPARKAWAQVTSPEIGTISSTADTITVPYVMEIGYDGADSVDVIMKDEAGIEISTKSVAAKGSSGTAVFTPSASGQYKFSIVAIRADEENKVGTDSSVVSFSLPLSTPSFNSATSMGVGKVALVWSAVKEATAYGISYSADGTNFSTPISVTGTATEVTGLTVGTTYTFKVVATRGTDVSSSAIITATTTTDAQRVWSFSAFGQGISTNDMSYAGSVNSKDLSLWSKNGKGKLVPASTDGLGFYYTSVDKNTNFTLSAKIKVDSWKFSNGQEGFGLMAADAVGANGDSSVFWNNSYMLSATKVEYFYDADIQAITTDTTKSKISMKLGIGAQEKKGVTLENISRLQNLDTATVNNEFKSVMNTLETSASNLGSGAYNIIGNSNPTVEGTQENSYTEINVTLKRDNTGYRCIFTDRAGNVLQRTYYDYDGTNLTQLDEKIYVGFYTSRNAEISVSDVSFTTINRADDVASEKPETTFVTPSYTVSSPTSTGISDYNLTFVANADGVVTIKDPAGNVIVDAKSIVKNEVVKAPTFALAKGANKFTVTFKPNDDFVPGEYQLLSSYEEVTMEHSVTYKTYGVTEQSIWVSPTATSKGLGSKADPMDIYTAVKFVQPGQTIVIKEGTYNLETTVKVARGVSGTASSLITMVADPDSKSRPVFDFGGICAGMIFGGDYWYIKGFDVTNSQNGQKGIQVSGNNITLDQINTYHNGNTGIQVSRLLVTDLWENWPANNLILNCTSYGNADAGYEDADGFAAKLTIADGNVFRGCIAYNNADDGWDLFAKVESGTIGKVVIDNCLAYGNGYLEDGTNAGNGNGFKLGGSSMTGYHELRNSIAYNNKAKGIDSNSCPDIQVVNCTTFNNGSYNIALYTSDAKNTDFSATGVLSFRTVGLTTREEIKLRGTQDITKVINTTNYLWDEALGKSVNNFASEFKDEKATGAIRYTAPAFASAEVAEASTNWFTSLDTKIVPTRDTDGSINMNGLLTLTEFATATVGARLIATPSNIISIPSEVPGEKPTEPGTSEKPTEPGTSEKPTEPGTSEKPTEPGTSVVDDNIKVIAGDGETITNEDILSAISKLKQDQEILIDTTKGSVSEIGKSIFKIAAEKNAKVVIVGSGYKWEFSNISANTELSLQSAIVTIDAENAEITGKLGLDKSIDSSKVVQISFAHTGTLPSEAKVTLSVKDKYATGTTLHFYYFNPATGLFESMQTCTVDAEGNVQVTLTHCSEYILIENELSKTLTTAAVDTTKDVVIGDDNGVTVPTGDKTSVKLLVVTFIVSIVSGIYILSISLKRKRRKINL